MRKAISVVGATVISSGLFAAGAPAYADSAGNNGINVLNDNNVSVVPVQVCNSGAISVGSVLADAGSGLITSSPGNVDCANAPIIDHSQVTPPAASEPTQPPVARQYPQIPEQQQLPIAPQPVVVPGHQAVTG